MMRWLIVACCFSFACGCYYTQVSDGIISTRDIDFNLRHEVDFSRRISASDREHILFGFVTGEECVQDAIDNAFKHLDGECRVVGLANARATWYRLWLLFYRQDWYTVEGCPIYEIDDPAIKETSVREVESPAESMTVNPSKLHEKQVSPKNGKNQLTDLPF